MAKAATATKTAALYYVAIDKVPNTFPLMGLVDDSDRDSPEIRHESRPKALHYRPLDHNGRRQDRWLTEKEANRYAADNNLPEIPDKWARRPRPRFDLVSRMFKGCVIEATSEANASAEFMTRFGINNTNTAFVTIKKVPKSTRRGLVNPIGSLNGKKRPTEV